MNPSKGRRKAQEVPFFSVIIATYGRPEMLREAVSSVLSQTFRDWELIIVDDAGPAKLPTFSDSRISVLTNVENLGKAASVNRALDLARGTVVAFLDDDDAWTPLRLAHAHEAHAKGADVVVCGSTELGAESAPTKRRWMERIYRMGLSSDSGHVASMGQDSVARDLCPDFDESFVACEDADWAIRVWQNAHSVALISPADFLWRRHSGYRHHNGTRARIEGTKQLLEKHREYYSTHRRERSFRLYRMALLYWGSGSYLETRKYALASLKAHANLRAAKWLVASLIAPLATRVGRR